MIWTKLRHADMWTAAGGASEYVISKVYRNYTFSIFKDGQMVYRRLGFRSLSEAEKAAEETERGVEKP